MTKNDVSDTQDIYLRADALYSRPYLPGEETFYVFGVGDAFNS